MNTRLSGLRTQTQREASSFNTNPFGRIFGSQSGRLHSYKYIQQKVVAGAGSSSFSLRCTLSDSSSMRKDQVDQPIVEEFAADHMREPERLKSEVRSRPPLAL